jgi:hypothetical protein
MSQQAAQALEIAAVAQIFTASILYLARTNRISFRYTMGWLTLFIICAFTGLLIPLIKPLATKLQLDAFALIAASAIIILLALCIQLSISISGLQKQLQQLNEDLALQKKAVEDSHASSK